MDQNRVLWAIDPFEQDLKMDPATLQSLSEWVWRTGKKIEPVYVVTAMQCNAKDVSQIEARIKDFFQTICINTENPKVLINPTRSVAGGAQCVVDHARDSGASLIV